MRTHSPSIYISLSQQDLSTKTMASKFLHQLTSLRHIVEAILKAVMIMDGAFYVWLEYVASPQYYDANDSRGWVASGVTFGSLAGLSIIFAYLGFVSPLSVNLQVNTQAFHILHKAHLVGGILASFSHLGKFENDNPYTTKWKHVLLIPLLVILCIQHERISFGSFGNVTTKTLLCIFSFVGICLALGGETQNAQMSPAFTHTSQEATTTQNQTSLYMGLCTVAVGLCSPCTFLGTKAETKRKKQIQKGMKALITCMFLLLFQWKFGVSDRNAYGGALVERWYMWPFILASCFHLMASKSKSSIDTQAKISNRLATHFDVGLYLVILLAGTLLSSANLLVRIIITLILGIWKFFL